MRGCRFHINTGTPQNPATNAAPGVAQQSTPPTASTGSVGGQQATPGSSLADITSSVCVCVYMYACCIGCRCHTCMLKVLAKELECLLVLDSVGVCM